MAEMLEQVLKAAPYRFKPYPAYRDSGIEWLGQIPEHWEVRRLKRIFSVANGSTPQSAIPEFWDGDILWVTPDDLGQLTGAYIQNTRRRITEAGYRSCGTTLAPAGSLVLSTRAPIGHLAIAAAELCTNQGCRTLAFRRPDVRQYLYFQLLAARAELESLGQGSTFKELAKSRLENLKVTTPPAQEQRAIAAFLDRETTRIDALVAEKERLIELLQEQRIALITRAVTKGLDPNVRMKDSGVEWLGEIPAHWAVKRIKNLSTFVTSGSRGWAEHYTTDGALFLRIGNLRAASIDLDLSDVQHVTPPPGAEGERTRVRRGDLLISITALIGAVGVVPEGIPDAFVNQHLALVRLSSKLVRPRWLGYCVLSRVGQEQLRADLYGGTKDGLALEDIRSLTVLIPSTNEQERIIDQLDSIGKQADALIGKIRQAIEHIKELRTALVSAAVTGKIDVRGEVA